MPQDSKSEGDACAAPPVRIEDALASEGLYVGTVVGVSMRPLLRARRDTIVVEPPRGRLRAGDVALYRHHDTYVLHRVVAVREGGYDILGDNCARIERNVPDEAVIGVLTGIFRDERPVDLQGRPYRAYVRGWMVLSPARCALMRARGRLSRAAKRLLGRP